jgi:hypothetical protein
MGFVVATKAWIGVLVVEIIDGGFVIEVFVINGEIVVGKVLKAILVGFVFGVVVVATAVG